MPPSQLGLLGRPAAMVLLASAVEEQKLDWVHGNSSKSLGLHPEQAWIQALGNFEALSHCSYQSYRELNSF